MSAFSTFDIAGSALGTSQFWLDTIGHNLANLNTVRPGDEEPFRAHMVVAQEIRGLNASQGRGVAVTAVVEQGGDAPRIFDPENPMADEDGYVVHPVVDLGGQMTDLIIAQRSYQANLQVVSEAREAYQSALRIGRG
ncbi:MAG: flagellar basal body rod protein FlgC [Acidimicrobiia bacterium]